MKSGSTENVARLDSLNIVRMWPIAMLAWLLLVGAGESELVEARREAEEAGRDWNQASRAFDELSALRSARALAADEVARQYDHVSESAELLGLKVAALTEDVRAAEASMRLATDRTEQAVAEAYMTAVGVGFSGSGAQPAGWWWASGQEQLVSVAEVLASTAEKARRSIGLMASLRVEAETLRTAHTDSLRWLMEVRQQTETDRDRLLRELVGIDARVGEALIQLATLETTYQTTQDRLALAERKAAALAGVEHWRDLVARYFPSETIDDALAVMRCESRGNPDAVNTASGATGLFQFMAGTWAWVTVQSGWGGANRFDPEANVAMASWLVDYSLESGRGPWDRWSCRTVLG